MSLISDYRVKWNWLPSYHEHQPGRQALIWALFLPPLPPYLQLSPKHTMPTGLSDPVETIVRRKEHVIWGTDPREKGRKWTGIVYFAWLYNETAVWACEKNESWPAQPLANRWVLRRWYVEPGEEAKEEISFHSAHIVNFPSQDLLDSPLPGQKVPGRAGSQQPTSTGCCSNYLLNEHLPQALLHDFPGAAIKIISGTINPPGAVIKTISRTINPPSLLAILSSFPVPWLRATSIRLLQREHLIAWHLQSQGLNSFPSPKKESPTSRCH